ncbi:MAG: hypothetical protein KA408_05120 [Flavobacteriales bacterium]|nr:hypothetical protein [Flavobacteriales bacterium]
MNRTIRNIAGIIAITGLVLTGCGGADDGTAHDADGAAAMNDGTADQATGDGHDHADGTADHEHGDATLEQANGMDNLDASATEARTFMVITYKTPAEERTGTTTALNGLRSTLMAELDAVRGRLKTAGADAAAKDADQKRAAELAQGLERMDRLIKKVGEADDVSWANVRESSLKEAEEVRVWMQQYNMPNSI